MIMPNTLRAKLAEGRPTIGTHFLFADPDIPEIIGDTGYTAPMRKVRRP